MVCWRGEKIWEINQTVGRLEVVCYPIFVVGAVGKIIVGSDNLNL